MSKRGHWHILAKKSCTIVNIRRQRGCVAAALNLIGRQQAAIAEMITHRFSFAETKTAFDVVAEYRDGVVKAIEEVLGPAEPERGVEASR